LGSAKYVSASQPNPSPASSSAGTAKLGSASQPSLSPEPSVQAEGREQWHHFNQTRGPVYARIPSASRNKASQVLSTLLLKTYTVGGKPEWDKLYGFAREGLGSSKRGGKKHTSQATLVNKRLDAFVSGSIVVEPPPKKTTKAKSSGPSKADYASRVAAKLGMGDVRGAVTIVTSKEAILPPSQETKAKLQVKHPPRKRSDLTNVPIPDVNGNLGHFWLSKDDVQRGLRSFKKGAAGGPDGLRPQHLLDMTGQALGETGNRLLETLVDFFNLCVLPGKVNVKTQATFYSGNLTALMKLDGGVRPIVSGLVFRRLAAKCVMKKLRSFCEKEFRPLQMGVGTPKGCEAAVHATRAYVESDSVQDQVLLKIDFKNAFNSVHRDVVLKLVREKVPEIYNFVYQCYEEDSYLFFGDDTLDSSEGVQQGDPLGPFLFSLAIMDIVKKMKSDFNVWYLDDGTIAGNTQTVLDDYCEILKALDSHGLAVNPSKCELHLIRPQSEECKGALELFRRITPGVVLVDKANLTLLGAPIYPEGIEAVLESKMENLELMASRLGKIDRHSALYLLKNCFAMPKLTYFLRSSPCFLKPTILERYDTIIKDALVKILNIQLPEEAWSQATLPVAKGGLGLRPATEVAIAGYLSSIHASSGIVQSLLPINVRGQQSNHYESALNEWKLRSGSINLPQNPIFQSEWDKPLYEARFDLLLHSATSEAERARLLSVSSEGASDWLHAIPIPSLGLHLDPMSVHIACGLRLGATLCHPHECNCGEMVDSNGRHGLKCKQARGRKMRHDEVNKLLKRGLDQAKIPSTLEPIGLSRKGDGRRPDGLTYPTWKNGKCLIWDFTCADTLCKSYVKKASTEVGSAAAGREDKKVDKYSNLSENYHFVPVGVETYGAYGPQGIKLVKQIGKKIQDATSEKLSTFYLFQSISMAIQRGNAVCVMGCPKDRSPGLEGLFNFQVHEAEEL
jgi:hypothetical protein